MKLAIVLLASVGALCSIRCDTKTECDCPAFPNGDTITVGIKEKANVYSCCADRFELSFIDVKEDSRCPDGFNCQAMNPVWEGTAKVKLRINGVDPLELQIRQPRSMYFGAYTYTLLLAELTPHPKSGLPTDPNTYKARIVVNRNQ